MDLIEYAFSAGSVVLSNSCFDLRQESKCLFLLSTCTEELISTPKIVTFLPNPPAGKEKVPLTSNKIPYPEYLRLPISAFFTNLTAPNKEFPSV